jgi:hypothetical protein
MIRRGRTLAVTLACMAGVTGTRLASGQPMPAEPTAPAARSAIPFAFVPNLGQWQSPAEFRAQRGGLGVMLEPDALVLKQRAGAESAQVRMNFMGSRESVELVGLDRRRGQYSFVRGRDASSWRTGVPSFGQVRYRGVYDGIDLVVRDGRGQVEYDLLVEPGADLEQFSVCCDGVDRLEVARGGDLVMHTRLGPIRQDVPLTWCTLPDGRRVRVDCAYRLIDERTFGFEAPEWSGAEPLVVDPGLEWCTYMGGGDGDAVLGVTVDGTGVTDLALVTLSSDFPGVTEEMPGSWDIVVARVDPGLPAGDQLLWLLVIGGSGRDLPWAMDRDAAGDLYLTGFTESADFPTSPDAFDDTLSGTRDAFVLRVSTQMIEPGVVVWSTLLGGSSIDWGVDVEVQADGLVTVGGFTQSSQFPTEQAYDSGLGGVRDVFLSRLDPAAAGAGQLVWSTYLGGSADEGFSWNETNGLNDEGYFDLAVAATGEVLVASSTRSSNFPTTPGAHDTSYGGDRDAFVTRLNPTLVGAEQLEWSTYLGGNASESAGGLAVDPDGVVTVCGFTWSASFPTTPGAFDTSFAGANDGFIAVLDPTLPASEELTYSTLVGGSSFDPLRRLVLLDGDVIAGGVSASSDYPYTDDAHDTTGNHPDGDGVVLLLSPDGNGEDDLAYATALGGCTGWTDVLDLAVVSAGPEPVVVVGGETEATDLPVTGDAMDAEYGGGFLDGYVAMLTLGPATCRADTNGDRVVDVDDLLALILGWGDCTPAIDVNNDGAVDVDDLVELILQWGGCP